MGAAVDAGSLTSFVAGLSALHKSDVLSSMLLAQLTANEEYDRYREMEPWYGVYVETLRRVGWSIPHHEVRRVEPAGRWVVLASTIMRLLAPVASGPEIASVRATLNALKENPKNGDALELFEGESYPETFGNFQVFPAVESGPDVSMVLLALGFSAPRHVSGFLWHKWASTEVEVFCAVDRCLLDEAVYAGVREAVLEELGGRAGELVRRIEL